MRRAPRDTGPLTEHDRAEVDAFRRFLALDLQPGEPVPAAWLPYAEGTGPAPALEERA